MRAAYISTDTGSTPVRRTNFFNKINSMNDIPDNFAEYISQLLKLNGVSVVTVSDGWVFTFTKEKLKNLIDGLEEAENITIFVKSSEGLPVN